MKSPSLNLAVALASVAAVMANATVTQAQSRGDLQITPTRVVFEGSKRFEVLTLTNLGSDSATYQISVIQYRMNRAGKLELIDTPDSGQLFASDLVRFYPRSVTIAPGETQNVRVQLRLPSDLPAGEYRSHFAFNNVAPHADAGDEEATVTGGEEFAVHLRAVYGVSIPVIVRHGQIAAAVDIHDLAIVNPADSARDNPVVKMTLQRSGARSVFGNMSVYLLKQDGSQLRIGGANGIAVYAPIGARDVQIPLRLPNDVSLAGGTVAVEYQNRVEDGEGIIARAQIHLP